MPHPMRRSFHPLLSRREMLARCGMGMGALSLARLLRRAGVPARARAEAFAGAPVAPGAISPLAAKPPHVPRPRQARHPLLPQRRPVARRHVRPQAAAGKYAGKPLPTPNLPTERKTGAAFPSPFKFAKHGQSGLEISDLFPHLSRVRRRPVRHPLDEGGVPNHEPSLMLMNCGDAQMARPSVGAWVTYGLGTENQNLPGFVAMCPGGYPIKEAENWQNGFLPGVYQGTYVDTPAHRPEQADREHPQRRRHVSPGASGKQLDLLRELNAEHLAAARAGRPARGAASRASSSPTACRPRPPTRSTSPTSPSTSARCTATASTRGRRSSPAGCSSAASASSSSGTARASPGTTTPTSPRRHASLAKQIDQPVAALLTDLKQRGMLDDTLVLFGGEFGRTPTVELTDKGQPAKGRDHNPYGFSVWLAGGGVKGGTAYGATDEFGFRAVENVVHVHDLHATMLHLLGFDHEQFTYRYAGRDFRLTDVSGRVVREILA